MNQQAAVDMAADEDLDWDELLLQATRIAKAKKLSDSEGMKVKALRKAIAEGKASAEELKENLEIVRRWEIKREWVAVANVALFSTQHCSCGAEHSHFQGFFQEQKHRHTACTRWIPAPLDQLLPKTVKHDTVAVGVCTQCASAHGWS